MKMKVSRRVKINIPTPASSLGWDMISNSKVDEDRAAVSPSSQPFLFKPIEKRHAADNKNGNNHPMTHSQNLGYCNFAKITPC